MKNVLQLLALGLAANTVTAANCRPSKPASSSSSASSVSSVSSASASPSPSSVCTPAINAVSNNDFTNGETGWSFTGQSPTVFAGYCGSPSHYCVDLKANNYGTSTASQTISGLVPGGLYTFSVVYYLSAISAKSTCQLSDVESDGSITLVDDYTLTTEGNAQYKTYVQTFTAGTSSMVLTCGVTETGGSIYNAEAAYSTFSVLPVSSSSC